MTKRLEKRPMKKIGSFLAIVVMGISIGHACRGASNSAPDLHLTGAGKVVDYAISPNGSELAEVRIGSTGGERLVLLNLKGDSDQLRTLLDGVSIGQILWEDDRSLLAVISRKGSELVREDVVSGQREVLLKSKRELSIAAYDRDRGLLAYVYTVPWAWNGRVSVRVTSSLSTLELLEPAWARWPETVMVNAIHVSGADKPLRVERIPLVIRKFSLPPTLAWRQGRLLALVSTLRSWRTRLIDLESGRQLAPGSHLYRMSDLTVSQHGEMVVVSNKRYWGNQRRIPCGCNGSLHLYRLRKDKSAQRISAISNGIFVEAISGIWWAPRRDLFAQVMGYRRPGGAPRWFLEEINTAKDTLVQRWYWHHGDVGGDQDICKFNSDRAVAVCEVQTLRDPPKLVRIDMKAGIIRVLGAADPTQQKLKFHFLKIKVPSRFGHWSTGFLAVPLHYRNGAIPLAVMSYDFTEAYSRNAQWITSYPVARLIHSGIAVLLMNWAGIGSVARGRFAESKRALESAVSLYANAISAVRNKGVRVSRAMAMGWSFGGIFAAHAIQTLPMYVAAQIGDPADYNITAFGLGGEYWRNQSNIMFGGPPTGRYLKRYQYLDPAGDGRPAMGPILLEFVSRNPEVGQLIQEWRAAGTDVEAFAYRRSIHWLNVSAEARISRLRNLYWAKLNLLGPHAVTSSQLRRVGLTVPLHSWWNLRSNAQRRRE